MMPPFTRVALLNVALVLIAYFAVLTSFFANSIDVKAGYIATACALLWRVLYQTSHQDPKRHRTGANDNQSQQQMSDAQNTPKNKMRKRTC